MDHLIFTSTFGFIGLCLVSESLWKHLALQQVAFVGKMAVIDEWRVWYRDSSSCFRETSTNPVSVFGRNEPPLRFHENLRSEGYDEYFDPPLENKYECSICLLGLREPVQTPCGHRFCRGCIIRSIR